MRRPSWAERRPPPESTPEIDYLARLIRGILSLSVTLGFGTLFLILTLGGRGTRARGGPIRGSLSLPRRNPTTPLHAFR